jgi:hypothetical protein
LAQYELIHQLKEGSFPDVTFALGTTQALFLGVFLYEGSSTPRNSTVFAFHKQEPNSTILQMDFLICHLIQEQSQKKSIDESRLHLNKQYTYLLTLSVTEHNSNSLQRHQASYLAMEVSAPTTSNILCTT